VSIGAHGESGGAAPAVRSLSDIEALERIPLQERVGTASTVQALLERGASLAPAKPALRFLPGGDPEADEIVVAHAELMARVDRAAQLFRSLGVGRHDAVALMLPNLPQAYAALFGAMGCGIAMPINWMLRGAQLRSLLETGNPKVLVAMPQVLEEVRTLPQALLDRMTILRSDGEFEAACERQSAESLPDGPEEADIAACIHTGGATGQPKLAKVLHRAIAYKCWAYRELLAQRADHVALGVSPLFHVGGIVLRAIHPLACGMSIVIPGELGLRDPEVRRRYWDLVAGKRITDMSAVPTSLGALAGIDPGAADLSSLRPFAITGSSMLPVSVAKRLQDRTGVRLLCDYGLTEYTATVAVPPPAAEVPEGSCGLRLPYTQVRIARLDGGMCASNEIGEIQVQGPGLVDGYLDARANANLFTSDGWARTGDLGRMDAQGFLFITGRAKDIIVRGGHNIDPRVIEETLLAHPDVALAAAVGRLDAYAGELPVAYVQLKAGANADAGALQVFARERISERAAAPVAVHILDELPLTGAGKIDKPRLREMSACAAIGQLLQACNVTAVRVQAACDPLHGTVYRVVLAGDVEAAERAAQSLAALPCRCEITRERAKQTAAETPREGSLELR
jgi:fatty-acyl-CoA synthase